MRLAILLLLGSACVWAQAGGTPPPQPRGYYRYPSLHNETVIFTAEGDLWTVPLTGGTARRLTSHPAEELQAHYSPDGTTIAFTASYEGNAELYTMPATGGLPVRKTFIGAASAGWTPEGQPMITTSAFATLPDLQMAIVRDKAAPERIALSQASQGTFDPSGKTFFFTRQRFQGSVAKRYKGGTAQNLWKYTAGTEAVPLTADYTGTSKDAMYWKGRIYFLTDRDGTMNLWSMDENGKALKQHTKHEGWDIASPDLNNGRIVYQMGADLFVYDIAKNEDKKLDIQLPSDFDQLRERWVKEPIGYTSSVALSPEGDRVAFTSRGRVFVAPVKQGRWVEATAQKQARYRNAIFSSDGKSVLAFSSETGELEIWKLPVNGVGASERLTTDGHVLRWEMVPSPDGKYILHSDKDNQLWLLDAASKQQKMLKKAQPSGNSGTAFDEIAWSPDSKWFTFTSPAEGNQFDQIFLGNAENGSIVPLTTDRYNSASAKWSPTGKFIYFLSDRALESVVASPWGSRQPDPYFNRSMKIYQLTLKAGTRSPFAPADELNPDKPEGKDAKKPGDAKADAGKAPDTAKTADGKTDAAQVKPVEIELAGLVERIDEVPAPPGNYADLTVQEKRLCWINRDAEEQEKTSLQCMDINNDGDKPETLMEGVRQYWLSANGKKLMLRKGNDLMVFDAGVKEAALKAPKALADARVDLKDWSFSVIPAEEYREAFADAWRLHRDYFYDKKMHGVDWKGMRAKYEELIGRVRDRAELNDLIAQLVSELSVLHTFVRGGDMRPAPDAIPTSTLGAELVRDEKAGGWTVKHIYRNDPDRPDRRSPLARPETNVKEGETIVSINGHSTLDVPHPHELLRRQAGKQVLLHVKSNGGAERDVIVRPLSMQLDAELRYHEWEYTRRIEVDKASAGKFGYVHLRAMGTGDIAQWAEHFYPIYNRDGLIIDVRHNRGGNIDSWILGKLLRKAWMYWQPREGSTYWNMQYAFRGPIVVLMDEWTASDGEAFSEGFRRLGLGQLIGTRTWGGEIWLTASNVLADRGIASAAEMGVFGPEGKWLIEGHGVEPDITVDNLPHATFEGKDAQLEAAVKYLSEQLKRRPVVTPAVPAYPDKSFHPGANRSKAAGGQQ